MMYGHVDGWPVHMTYGCMMYGHVDGQTGYMTDRYVNRQMYL